MNGLPDRSNVISTLVPFLMFQLPMVPALFLLESGVYSAEIGEYGEPVGALWIFMLYLVVASLAFATVWFAVPHRAPPAPHPDFVRGANVASTLLLAFYCIPLLVYGPVLLTGETRYEFLDHPYVPIFNVKLYLGMICAYHGWMLRLTRRISYLLFFVAVLVAMVAWGEKFSGPQYAIVYFAVGLTLAGGALKKVVGSFLVLVPLALAIWALPTVLAGRSDELADAFRSRVARQAQVFYKVIDEPPAGPAALNTLEVLDYFGTYTPSSNGMNYLKDQYIAEDLRGVHKGSFAAGYPAIVLSGGILPGLVVIFVLELIRFTLLREILIVGFRAQNLLLWPVYLYLLNYLGKIFESGNTYLLTSPVFLGMVAIVLVFNRMALDPTLGLPRSVSRQKI